MKPQKNPDYEIRDMAVKKENKKRSPFLWTTNTAVSSIPNDGSLTRAKIFFPAGNGLSYSSLVCVCQRFWANTVLPIFRIFDYTGKGIYALKICASVVTRYITIAPTFKSFRLIYPHSVGTILVPILTCSFIGNCRGYR